MGFGEHRRFIVLAIVAAGLGAAGCRDFDPDLDPPEVKQIVCREVGKPTPSPSLVYVLDTGADRVTWANGPGAPEGRLKVEDHAYRFDFGDHAATVNRFDGDMVRETGRAPFLDGGAATKDNRRLAWTCAAQAEGPKF